MNIKFLQDIEVETVVGLEQDGNPIVESDHFKVGEEAYDVELLDVNAAFKTVSIQFGDGSVAFGVPNISFELIS